MQFTRFAPAFGVAALLFAHLTPARAQSTWPQIFWIRFQDDAAPTDTCTVFFGSANGATYCIDSLSPTIRELEAPPLGPGFDVRFKNIPSRSNWSCYGQGLLRYDFVPLQMIDTFQIAFSDNDSPGALWTLRWAEATYLSQLCGSILLYVPTMGMMDMMKQDSLQISAPGDSGISFVRVFTYIIPLDVDGGRRAAYPGALNLCQSYPNPFNPSATIEYHLPARSRVMLGVFDILGREVATLADATQDAGIKSASFDGSNLGSGVYFYRLTATSVSDPRASFTKAGKMILTK